MPKSYTFRDFDGTYGLKESIEVGMYFVQILVYSKSISIQSTKKIVKQKSLKNLKSWLIGSKGVHSPYTLMSNK